MNGKQKRPKKGRIGDRYRKVNLNNENIVKKNKKEITKIAFLVVILLTVVLGTSYALFTVFIDKGTESEIVAGTFNVQFNEGRNINLTNASPMSDEEGLATEGHSFTIENTGTINANYNVILEEKTTTGNTLDKKYIKYSVKVGDGEWSTPKILGENQNGMLINNGELSATPGENQVKYEIKLWLREDADNSAQGKSFSARLVVSGVQNNADRLDKIGGATPIIKLNGASVVNIKQGEEYQELGVSAVSDDKDTITVNEVEYSYTYLENNEEIETNTIDTYTTGIYYVYYKVTDSDGNTGVSVRVVNVVADETSSTEIPSIKLKGDSIIRVAKGSEYKEPGVTATINDKDVSNKVVTVGAVNTKVEGTYVIKYIIKTSNGNISSVTRTVIVEQIGKITMKVTEPKYVNNKAEMTITVTSDGGYVNGYAITKSEKQPTDREFEKLKEASKVTKDIKISKNGVYYIWSKDSNGNITSEKVEINKIDDEKPICVFNDVGYAALDGTTSIELTCTDTSGLKTTYLDNDNFEIIDSNKATITNISGIEEIENGFKYVIDIKGLNLGEFTIKFKANSISDIYGNKNSESTSGNIEVTDFKVDSDSINLNVTGENTHQITVTGNKGELEYSSSNTSVATVSDTGLITAVSVGSATITVTDTKTNIKKKITVDVEKYITAQLIKQGRGVTSIADSNKEEIVEISCKLTKSNTTSCEVLLPDISVSEEYTALGWSANSNSHDPEYKIGDKATITIDGENKFYPISKRDSITKTAIFNTYGYGADREEIYDDVTCKTNEIYNDEEIDDSCEITLPSITVYDGYTARGWSQNKDTKIAADISTDSSAKDGYIEAGKKIKIDSMVYLYTITSKNPKELTAKYNANGATLGEVNTNNTNCTTTETWNNELPSMSCNVSAPTITRDGFTISGFSTSKDALKEDEKSADNVIINGQDIPLTEENTGKTWYAQTKKDISVIWNSNGATITSTQSACSIINTDTSCSITSPGITRDGYNVVGFSEKQDDDGTNENTIWKNDTIKTFTGSDNNRYEYYAISNKELSASITYYTDDNTVKGLKNSSKNVIVKRLNTTDSNNNRVSETEKCLVSNKNTTCDITVPEVVKQSKGPSNIDYAGLAKEVNSEKDLITTDTFAITKDDDYYAIYKTEVKPKFYYYNGSNVVYDDSVTGTRLAILKEKDGEYTIVQEALSAPTIVTQSKGLSDSSNYFGVSTTKSSKNLTSSVSTANEEYYTVYKEIWNVSYSKDETAIKSIGSSISTCDNYQTTDGNEYTIKGENCSVNLPAITPNPSYKSLGWYDGTTKVGNPTDSYLITGNKELIAKGEINEYTVTYDYKTNGGDSVSEVSKSTQIGSPVDLSVTATKEGWKFVGWNTDKDAHDKLGSLVMPGKKVTLYAIFKKDAIPLTASFDANNAKLSSTSALSCEIPEVYNNAVQGTSCSVTAPTITAPSNTPTIVGYNTTADAKSNNSAYNKDNGKLTLTSSNTGKTWYAQTKKDAVSYTVSSYEKGSNVSSIGAKTDANSKCTIAATYNGTKQATSCSVTAPTITANAGYTSVGWSLKSGDTTGSSTITLNSSNTGKTWYANATANSYTIKYYNENQELSPIDTAKVGDNPTIKTADDFKLSKVGYTLKGWSTTNGGNITYNAGQKYGDLTTVDNEVVNLYAVWVDETAPVCSFSSAAATTTGNTTTMTLTCTDQGSGIENSELTTSNFTASANGEVTNVSAPTAVTNGYSYVVTVKGKSVGTFTTSLNKGSISDKAGNSNAATTSPNITVNGRTYKATFVKNSAGVTEIYSTSISCTTTGSSLSCTPTDTVPTITVAQGYTSIGWNTDKTAHTSLVNAGDKITLSEDVKYYAISKKDKIKYTATFNRNGAGTQTKSDGTASSDDSVTRSCDIAEVYNNEVQATTCDITTPKVTGSDNTPIVLDPAYATTASATVGTVKQNTTISLSSNVTYYAITKSGPITLTANWNANNATLSSSAQSNCNIAATYNGKAQATSCTVTAPTITAPASTPTILGYNTTAGANSNNSSYNTTTKVLTLTSENTGKTWYAQTKKDAVSYTVSSYEKGSNVSSIGTKTDANSKCTIAATYNGTKQATSCSVTAPTITANTGYTSVGWSLTSGDTTGSSTITLKSSNTGKTWYANATANSYTINYYDETAKKGSSAAKVGTNPTLTKASNLSLSKTGYTFKGWATTNGGTVVYTDGQTITGNLATTAGATVNLYAVWADETAPVCSFSSATAITTGNTTTMTLTCTDQGSGIENPKLTISNFTTSNVTTSKDQIGEVTDVSAPTAVTNGYSYVVTVKGASVGTFTTSLNAGSISDKAVNSNATTTSPNITVNGRTYTATFVKNGTGVTGISSTSISCTTTDSSLSCIPTATVPTITVAQGYTSIGWNTDKTAHASLANANSQITLSGDVTYYTISKKNKITYTATFNRNGAGTQTKSDGTASSDASVTRSCDIAEVYNNEVQATTCNITTPKVTGSTNTPIVLDPAYATTASATVGTVKQNTTISLSSNVTYYAITKSGPITLTANWNDNNATLSSSAQSNCNIAATYNGKAQATSCSVTAPTITAPANTPTILGYNTTADANSNNSSYNATTKVLTLTSSNTGKTWYAQTKKDAVSYTVSSYEKGSNVSSIGAKTDANSKCTIAATYNGKAQATSCSVTAPTITANTGYTSVGWSLESGATTGSSTITLNSSNTGKTWYANAKINTYTITYNVNGGEQNTSTEKLTYGSKYNFPTVSRTGYTFIGWFDSSTSKYDTSKKYKDYPLYYYADVNSDLYKAFGYNQDSLYSHYQSNGKNEGRNLSQYNSSSKVTSNQTLYAGWLINKYTVTYNANGGSYVSKSSDSVQYGAAIDLKPEAFRKGYTFKGWSTTSTGATALTSKTMEAGNVTLYAIWKDETKPTIKVSSSPSTAWTSANKKFTVTATDTGSGIAGYYISTSNTTPPTSGWDTSTSNTKEYTKGVGTYYIWVKDNAENISSSVSVSVTKIDTTAPSCSIEVVHGAYNSSGWYTTTTQLRMLVSGGDSLEGGTYDFTRSSSPTYSNNLDASLVSGLAAIASPELSATSTWYGYVKNAAGVTASCSKTVKVDTVTPTVTLSVTKSSAGTSVSSGSWSNQGLKFTLTKSAVGSSGSTIKYCKDTTNTCTPSSVATSGTAITDYTSATGTYYFRYQAVGGNGKSSSISTYTAKVDTSSPTAPTITNSSNGNWTNNDVTVSLKSTDSGGSSVAKYQIKYSGTSNAWKDASNPDTWAAERNETIYYRAVDNAGNTSTSSSTNIKIDKTPPRIDFTSNSIRSVPVGTNEADPVTITDSGGSGWDAKYCDIYTKSLDNYVSTWVPTGFYKATGLSVGNVYYLKCFAVDNAANKVTAENNGFDIIYGSGWSKTYSVNDLSVTGGPSKSSGKLYLVKDKSSAVGYQDGPYTSLSTGCYKVTYSGSGLNNSSLNYIPSNNKGTNSYPLYKKSVSSSSATYYIKVTDKVDSNVEYRISTTINKGYSGTTSYIPTSAPYITGLTVSYVSSSYCT